MRNNIIIAKMLGYIEKILSYCEGIDYESFVSNSLLTEACVFNLSQLGELTRNWIPNSLLSIPTFHGIR